MVETSEVVVVACVVTVARDVVGTAVVGVVVVGGAVVVGDAVVGDVVVLGADVTGAPAAVVVDRSGGVTLTDGRVTASPPDPPDPQPTSKTDRAMNPTVKENRNLRMAHMMTESKRSAEQRVELARPVRVAS